ncbi:MAG: UvrD-helicase domain-containing protein, partial [Gemmataceae bacterium]
MSPFRAPADLEQRLALLRHIHGAMTVYASEEPLLPFLGEQSLDGELRAAIADRVACITRARRRADFEDYRGTTNWHRHFKKEMAASDTGWEGRVRAVYRRLRGIERECAALETQHADGLRMATEAELAGLRAQMETASVLLAEATDARGLQTEIDSIIEKGMDAFIADQTRKQQDAYDAAIRAAAQAQHDAASLFRARLADAYLTVRIDDFVPAEDDVLRGQLDEIKTQFVRDWASRQIAHALDREQAAAVGSVHENLLVTARAGSGKTSTLAARAAFLVRHCGVPAEAILLLVFNRNAAAEMRERCRAMGCDVPHAMTFHALAYAIVHPEEALIYDSPDGMRPDLSRAFQQVVNDFLDEDPFRADVRSVMLGHF